MGTGADMQMMSGTISAMGIMQNAEVQAQNIRQQGQDSLFQYEYMAGQNKLAEKLANIRASETDLYMRRRANNDIGNVEAVMAMDGTAQDSPSSMAVVNALHGRADESREHAMWNQHMEAQGEGFASNLHMMQGYKAMSVANYNSIATIASGNMSAMGAMMSGIASAQQMRTEKSKQRFANMVTMASGALGVVGGFI